MYIKYFPDFQYYVHGVTDRQTNNLQYFAPASGRSNNYEALIFTMRCTVFVIVIMSVRLSVRLSVTFVHCVHMVRPTIMISTPYDSAIILVSRDITVIPKFEGGHPERGR